MLYYPSKRASAGACRDMRFAHRWQRKLPDCPHHACRILSAGRQEKRAAMNSCENPLPTSILFAARPASSARPSNDSASSKASARISTRREAPMDCRCNAQQLAHYVVDKCTRDGHPVSNLQLQKIMYFLQCVYCSATGALLFPEEFEAWPYGPVLSGVYHEYSLHGGRLIFERRNDVDPHFLGPAQAFIDDGIEILREESPWDLVKTSHAKGSPWETVWNGGAGYKQAIPNSEIRRTSCK